MEKKKACVLGLVIGVVVGTMLSSSSRGPEIVVIWAVIGFLLGWFLGFRF